MIDTPRNLDVQQNWEICEDWRGRPKCLNNGSLTSNLGRVAWDSRRGVAVCGETVLAQTVLGIDNVQEVNDGEVGGEC